MDHSSLSTTDIKIILRPLTRNDEEAFLKSALLWKGEDIEWYSFIYHQEKDKFSFEKMFVKMQNEHLGINLPEGRVAATMLYAFTLDGDIIGRFHIRHELNDYLFRRGGHIGYATATDYRKKGVATQMMQQGLEYIKQHLKLSKILITCADDNAGSYKLIEKFGGVLENKIWDDEDQEKVRRYWLTF